MLYSIWFMVLACLLLLAAQAGAASCSVNTPGTLKECLEDQNVTDIIIRSDYKLGDGLNQSAPLGIFRNVTVRGPSNISPDERPVLDMRFAYNIIQLCSSCTFTLSDLVITNDRKGSGPQYDLFQGKPGSLLRSINTYRLRPACTPADTQLKAYQSLERSKLLPNRTAPQGLRITDIVYKGVMYADSVWADETSYDAPYKYDEARGGAEGGYAAVAINSTRLCERYIDRDCLAVLNADACVNQLIDSLTAAAPGLPPSTAVAIAVPLVAGFLVASGFAAWWLRRRCHQRKAAGPAGTKSAHQGSDPHGPLRPSRTTAGSCSSSELSATQTGLSRRSLCKSPAGTKGWEVMGSATSPFAGVVEDDDIQLGDFIGAGSFGKVFKGRWNRMDVAVKVIEHDGSSYAAVEEEMDMMMSFNHPNIVRAFHCIHYAHKDGGHSDVSSTTHSRHGSGPSPMGTSYTPAGSFTAGSSAPARAGSSSSVAHSLSSAAAAMHGSTLGKQSSGVAAAGDSGSFAEVCHQGVDTAVAVAEGAAVLGRRVHFDAAGAVRHRVRFSEEGQQHNRSSDGPLMPPVSAKSVDQQGSDNAPQQQQQGAPDSFGSSVDCHCVAAAPSSLDSPQELRRSKSLNKPARRRYESWLVLELCDSGSLSSYTAQWDPPSHDPASILQVLQLLLDTAQGLEALHRANTVHGDLNARNVLVASCSEAACGVQGKLADFGLSRSIKQHHTHRTTNTIGTINHMPPEMLRSGKMSVFADVYAFGIMMWELYTGEDAFQRLQHPGQFFEAVVLGNLRPAVPRGMPADYQRLMQQCWATQPPDRPTASAAVECLQYMIQQRQSQTSGSADAPIAPPPLLAAGLQQQQLPGMAQAVQQQRVQQGPGGVEGMLQRGTGADPLQSNSEAQSGITHASWMESSSSLLLPAVDVEQPADTAQQHDVAHSTQLQPSSNTQAAAKGGKELYHDSAVGSSGGLPAFLAGLRARHGSGLALREDALLEEDVSWSNRQGSQAGGLGETAWFV